MNHLRHLYARRSMFISVMINPEEREALRGNGTCPNDFGDPREPRAAKPKGAFGVLEEAEIWGAIFGLGGGLAAALLGSVLTAAGWVTTGQGAHQWLTTTGTVLLCSTIPLIVLGACCLDWLEKGLGWSRPGRDDHEDGER
jgi:hypothetical protein